MKKLNDILFRQPREEDAKQIVEFYNEMGGETTYLSFVKDEYPLDIEEQKQNIPKMQKAAHCTMIVAFDSEEIVGIGTIHSGDKVKSRHCAELGIVVKKDYQGMGIGTHLMKQLIEFCKTNGITTKIQLDTRCDNVKAVELYEKLGFAIEGRLKNTTLIDGEYYDLYVMGMML